MTAAFFPATFWLQASRYDSGDRAALPLAPTVTATATATSPTLLVVDDEPELRGLLAEYFGRHGFAVQTAPDAAQAREQVGSKPPDLAVLDINMPGENGLSLARWLRAVHPQVAIVMLTTASESVDRIVGLELGADDYVSKPYELRELLARVRAVLRRSQLTAASQTAPLSAPLSVPLTAPSTAAATGRTGVMSVGTPEAAALTRQVRFGERVLDLDQRRLLASDGSEIEITAAEYDLLALFARHPNRPLNRDQIMEQAHNRGWDVFDRSIDLRVMRLRRKIETNPDKPEVLKTVRNVGYVFVPPH